MVGRLIKQQQVRRIEQELAQRNPPLFPARQVFDTPFRWRQAQRIHGNRGLALQVPGISGINFFLQFALFGDQRVHLIIAHLFTETAADFIETVNEGFGLPHAEHDVFQNRQVSVEFRFLRQITDIDAVSGPGLTLIFGFNPGHDLEQGRFTRTVDPQHPDLGTRQKGQ